MGEGGLCGRGNKEGLSERVDKEGLEVGRGEGEG